MSRQFMTVNLFAWGLVYGAPPLHAAGPAAAPEFAVPLAERQLFLDDHGIAEVENLKKTMHRPVKKGTVIPPPDPKQGWVCSYWYMPLWDPSTRLYKLWGGNTDKEETEKTESGRYEATYYESRDGVTWGEPKVHQVIVRASKAENDKLVVRIGGRVLPPSTVVYDPTDPDAGRRYKSFVFKLAKDYPKSQWHPAVSADGLTWEKLDVPSTPGLDTGRLSFDARKHLFIFTVKQYSRDAVPARMVTLATSKDFNAWTKPELMFRADGKDQELAREVIRRHVADRSLRQPVYNDPKDWSADVYDMLVCRYEGVYIGLPTLFHRTGKAPSGGHDGFHHVQLACSRDLRTWQHLGDRRAFIAPSRVGKGVHDTLYVGQTSEPFVHGEELWFYYQGHDWRFLPEGVSSYGGALCLAVLRRDGFVSLDAGEKEGSVLTRPFVLPKGELHVNVDAAGGKAILQVCDEKGAPVAGFETSEAISGDRVDATVGWPKERLGRLAGQKVRLRIKLAQARLYSYWLQ
jgi:hypothetical protein